MTYQTLFTTITARSLALAVIGSLLLSAFPASIFIAEATQPSVGLSVTPTSITTEVDVQANFKATVDGNPAATSTDIFLSDGDGGSFYDSNGNCSNTSPDGDNTFSIQKNKNVCYSNDTPGVYTIKIKLLDGQDGTPIAGPVFVTITVTEKSGPVEVNPNIEICHATEAESNPYTTLTVDAKSIVNLPNGHDDHIDGGFDDLGDIIPPFEYDFDGTGLKQYPGKNWTTDYSNGLTGQMIYAKGKCDGRPKDKSVDVAVTKAVSTTTPIAGSQVTYTIVVVNNGPDAASGVIVTDPLAADISYASSSITPAATSPLTWNVGTLPSGESWTVTVVATVDADAAGSSVTNTVTVVTSVTDTDPSNNEADVTIRPIENETGVVLGCTDTDATNYDATATVDNGTCLFPLVVKKQFSEGTYGTTTDFSFTVNGVSTTTFTASGTNMMAVASGTYTIREVAASGYRASYNNCDAINIAGLGATCTITNTKIDDEEPEQCVDEPKGGWADSVITFAQAKRKDGSSVIPARSSSTDALGVADWVTGGSTGFVSLGFGGTITVAFDSYVLDVDGVDISAYEATNGTYPAETASVSVSQDGTTWYPVGTVGRGVAGVDFETTGLTWVKYVRLTDTTDPAPHTNDADAYDLDAVRATVTDCDRPADPEPDTYRIEGFVWHDDNRNTYWDGEETEEDFVLTELPLGGWVVNITNGSSSYSTTTDENGYYYFEVVAGTWVITEVVQEGWERTTVESHTVTVPELYETSVLETVFSYILPVAYAAVLGTYGDYDFGNDTIDAVPPTPTPDRRSGGGGTRVKPKTLSTPTPTPLVLGEQVSVVPAGAPGAGQGGAAAGAFTFGQLLYTGSRRRSF